MNVGARLQGYLSVDAVQSFDWRSRNCCHFVAGWVGCLTGADPLAGLPPTPDAPSARRLVRQLGGSLQAAVTARLGPSVPPAQAHTGDVALLPASRPGGVGGSLGIVSGRHVWALTDSGELQAQPLDSAQCAWRVAP